MKAKEEYVDAPRETRSKDITVYAIIFLVLLVGAGIFLAVRLLHKPADAALADSKSGIIYDSSAVEGGWDNLSPEEIAEKLNENPVIAAVAEPERLPAALASDCGVVFLLSGDILSIGALVDAVKNAGKAAMVHLELIEGLSGKEIAVDAIHALTRADGIISTRAAQIKRARQLGLATIQRGFLLDSRSVRSLQAQAAQGKPDYVEILPGVIPRVIAELAHGMNTPLIAGGLIKTKEEVVAALGAGAVAVSTTAESVWAL